MCGGLQGRARIAARPARPALDAAAFEFGQGLETKRVGPLEELDEPQLWVLGGRAREPPSAQGIRLEIVSPDNRSRDQGNGLRNASQGSKLTL
jgi:hypothetical protein